MLSERPPAASDDTTRTVASRHLSPAKPPKGVPRSLMVLSASASVKPVARVVHTKRLAGINVPFRTLSSSSSSTANATCGPAPPRLSSNQARQSFPRVPTAGVSPITRCSSPYLFSCCQALLMTSRSRPFGHWATLLAILLRSVTWYARYPS